MAQQAGAKRLRTLAGLLLLAVLVAALHLWLAGSALDEMAGLRPDAPGIKRMQADYVSEVRLTRPPAPPMATAPAQAPPAPASLPGPRRKKIKPPPEAASAASSPEVDQAIAPALPPVAEAASTPQAIAFDSVAGTAQAAASSPSPDHFDWPQATRVSYTMEGFYRGPVHGQSSVEWIKQGQRYQVHIDASVGPSFAPLGSWRLSSEGEIRPDGLHPRRHESVNRLLIRSARSKVMELGDESITLPGGKQQPRTAGLQDPASFIIQVAYQFILDPSKARPGSSFEMTVLTFRKPEPLVFDVVEEVMISTPMGRIPALHVRPRKAMEGNGEAMPADVWFAPGLQYLPVRITVKMKGDAWLEMNLAKAPQQTPAQPDAPTSVQPAAQPAAQP